MKRFFSICIGTLLLLQLFIPGVCAQVEERGIIYVATNGNDANDGSIDKPLETLHAARNKIRELKKQGVSYPKGFVVYVREGNYFFDESLEFNKEDSGTAQAPVVYRSYPGETATLIGGIEVSGKQFQKVTDNSVLERIVDTSARDKIYMLDLKKYGVTEVEEPYLRGVYSYKQKNGQWTREKPNSPAMEVLFNGEAMQTARYPNGNGTISVEHVVEEGYDDFDPENTNPWLTPFSIIVSDKRLQHWTKADPESIIMYGFFGYDWADQSIPMKSINPSTGQIDSLWCSEFGIEAGKKFYVYNLLEELDQAGECYIDRSSCILYCYPPSDPGKAQILLTLLDAPLININPGAEHIKFRNFEVKGTRNKAFWINGNDIDVSNCEISFNASTAVEINGERSGIRDSYLHDVDTGINVWGGEQETLKRGESYAINNEVYRFSRLTKTYAPAIAINNVGNRVMHNELHYASHEAIAFGGNNNLVSYNEIYDVVRETDDAAAIYGGLNWQGRGCELKYNYIHDIATTSTNHVGVHAIYVDGGGCETFIVGNVVKNAPNAFEINGGRDNVVINNIMIDNKNGLVITDIMLNEEEEEKHYKNLEKLKDAINTDIWKETFPKLDEMLTDDGKIVNRDVLLPIGNIYQNNVLVNTPLVRADGSAGKYIDVTKNFSTKSDPGFYDYENGNYLLKKDSVVYEELPDFKPLPFTRMGRIDELADVRVQEAICLAIDSPYSLANGKKIQIDADNQTITPKIIEDRTFVPLRFIAEALGLNVEYDNQTGEITIAGGDILVSLFAGNTAAKKNGESSTMEKAAIIEDGRTLVPLREISNLFGKQVFWHDMGFITISNDEALFDADDTTEEAMIHYLYGKINIY